MKLAARNRWVEVRPIDTADLVMLAKAIRGSNELHAPWVDPPSTAAALREWLAKAEDGRRLSLLARDAGNGEPVGVFNLSEIVRGPLCSAYLGYYALVPYGGRGWMRAAMPLVLDVIFKGLKLHRVEANVQPENVASIALLSGAGFAREGYSRRYLKIRGRWRDHERWAMLAEDWQERRRHHEISEPR